MKTETIIRTIITIALLLPAVLVFNDNIYLQGMGVAYIWLLWYMRRKRIRKQIS